MDRALVLLTLAAVLSFTRDTAQAVCVDTNHPTLVLADKFAHVIAYDLTTSIKVNCTFSGFGSDHLDFPTDVAVDSDEGILFVSNAGYLGQPVHNKGFIMKAQLDGSNPVKILNKDNMLELWVMGIALDPLRRYVYFADDYNYKISRVSYDGGDIEDIISDGIMWTWSIAVDPRNYRLFWGDWDFEFIASASLDGTDRSILVNDSVSSPAGLHVDVENGRLYWCDNHYAEIESIRTDGSDREFLVTETSGQMLYLSDLILYGDRFYLASFENSLYTMPRTGGSIQEVADLGLGGLPNGVAVYTPPSQATTQAEDETNTQERQTTQERQETTQGVQ